MARRKYKEPEVSTQAPVILEFDDFKLELKGLTERIEERSRKKYGREIGVTGWLTWEGDDWVFEGLAAALEDVFKPWRVRVTRSCSGRDGEDGGTKRAWVNVLFAMVPADKPSCIITEDEAWVAMLPFDQACRRVQLGIERAHKAWNDKNELEDRAQQACSLWAWVRDQLYDGAEEAVDFENRLAALRQEVIAEVERRVAEREDGLLVDMADFDWQKEGNKFHPKAIKVGWEKGVKSALSNAASVGRSGFPRGHNRHITPEEVA